MIFLLSTTCCIISEKQRLNQKPLHTSKAYLYGLWNFIKFFVRWCEKLLFQNSCWHKKKALNFNVCLSFEIQLRTNKKYQFLKVIVVVDEEEVYDSVNAEKKNEKNKNHWMTNCKDGARNDINIREVITKNVECWNYGQKAEWRHFDSSEPSIVLHMWLSLDNKNKFSFIQKSKVKNETQKVIKISFDYSRMLFLLLNKVLRLRRRLDSREDKRLKLNKSKIFI